MDSKTIDILAWMIIRIIKKTENAKNLKIQKLIYIYNQEVDTGLFRTEFVSHNFGPYSSEVYEVLDILLANKFIIEKKYGYDNTEKSIQLCKKIESTISFGNDVDVEYFTTIIQHFVHENSDKMIKYVYDVYKEHLEKSIIIEGIEYKEADYEWIRLTKENIEKNKKKNI